jgi:uncharacterized protein YdiU (UPF0061 family)
MRAKLGLTTTQEGDRDLIDGHPQAHGRQRGGLHHLLAAPERMRWRVAEPVRDLLADRAMPGCLVAAFAQRLTLEPAGQAAQLMLKTNPKFVLRNHLGEQAIRRRNLATFPGQYLAGAAAGPI